MIEKGVLIGFLATITSALALLPTIYNVTMRRTTHSIHYFYIIISFIAQIFWLIYGIIINSWPIIALVIYMMVAFTTMLIAKFYLESTGQDMHSELTKKCNDDGDKDKI